MADDSAATFETREDAGENGPGIFRLWTAALDLAEKEEKDWNDVGQKAIDRYRDEKKRKGAQFNILYSSVQTQAPAIYNSTPIPDVRRRFNDEDPVGKIASQAFERTLSHCIDEYDFDSVMMSVVMDSLLPGRGVAMVEYQPVVSTPDILSGVEDEEGQPESVDYETVRGVHVQWDDFRRGPAKKWEDVPWVAVRYRITREEAVKLNPKIGPTVNLDHVEKNADKDGSTQIHDIFKRLTIWKIWDKTKRQIVFIAPSHQGRAFRGCRRLTEA